MATSKSNGGLERKKPKCVKGTACGFACINSKATCKSEVKASTSKSIVKAAKSKGKKTPVQGENKVEKPDLLSDPPKKAPVIDRDLSDEDLDNMIKDPNFKFEGPVGAKAANALLKRLRTETDKNVVEKVEPIKNVKEFSQALDDAYEQLNKEYNYDDLVPIYKIRRAIGERVSRSEFQDYMFELQANDEYQFIGGSVEDSAPDKIADSITSEISGLRCYAKRLKPRKK